MTKTPPILDLVRAPNDGGLELVAVSAQFGAPPASPSTMTRPGYPCGYATPANPPDRQLGTPARPVTVGVTPTPQGATFTTPGTVSGTTTTDAGFTSARGVNGVHPTSSSGVARCPTCPGRLDYAGRCIPCHRAAMWALIPTDCLVGWP